MPRILDVYLHKDYVGQLIQNEHGEMVFDYAQSWLENPHAESLSHSLPLPSAAFKIWAAAFIARSHPI